MWLFQLHCKEDPFYVFPEMKLCGLVPNLGMRPRGFISVNICFDFSVQCLCSGGAGSSLFFQFLCMNLDVNIVYIYRLTECGIEDSTLGSF